MPSVLLVQLRQLHPLKNAVCLVGAAETAAPPDVCSKSVIRVSSACSVEADSCAQKISQKKTLEPSAKPHANIVQVSAAKKFIIEKWKSCFEV